jgi:hypothetical protein
MTFPGDPVNGPLITMPGLDRRASLVAGDGERENFHRSARALPAARGHAGDITCRYGTAGNSLNS